MNQIIEPRDFHLIIMFDKNSFLFYNSRLRIKEMIKDGNKIIFKGRMVPLEEKSKQKKEEDPMRSPARNAILEADFGRKITFLTFFKRVMQDNLWDVKVTLSFVERKKIIQTSSVIVRIRPATKAVKEECRRLYGI